MHGHTEQQPHNVLKRLFCAQRALQSMNEIMCKGILHINEFCFFFFTFAKDIHFTRVFVITANFVFYFQRDSIECKSTLQIDWLANLMRNYYEIVGIPVSTFPFKEMHFLWFYFVFFFFFLSKSQVFVASIYLVIMIVDSFSIAITFLAQ